MCACLSLTYVALLWIHWYRYGDADADKGIMTSQDARFYAISAGFPSFSNEGKDLVIQFSVKHAQKIDCGGGYVKVSGDLDQKSFNGDSSYKWVYV